MIVVFFVFLLIAAGIKRLLTPRRSKSIDGRHVVVTGGSSGIGKCAAILAARQGAHVTIIARNLARLTEAENEIKGACVDNNQIITKISVDVSNKNLVERELNKIDETVGPIYMLVNCAGMAICGKVEDFNEEDVDTLIKANYLGTLYPIQTVIPKMKIRKEGIIVLTASQVALMGMYGYSIYSSCKFALRGLAESIHMELKPFNISVTLALPPDTDTPGFETENRTKPEETKLISETGGLIEPQVVAAKLLQDAQIGNFFSSVGFESQILTTLCVGMSPFSSLLELVIQSGVLGVLRLIGAYYLTTFHKIVQNCHLAKEKNK